MNQIGAGRGLRIVLVGKTGSGKSACGNTILGMDSKDPGAFESRLAFVSVTDSCKKASGSVNGRDVSVVDTPGLFDTKFSEDETLKKISDCIDLAAPGPHAFLIVIRVIDRFTEQEQKSVEIIQEVFGQESDKYTMVLFTNGDQLEGQTVEETFLEECPELKQLVSKCKGGYHVFNNKAKDPKDQVDELLGKIDQMVSENGGSHYTNEDFQEADRKIQEEKERERREQEEKRQKEEKEQRQKGRDEMKNLMCKVAAVVAAVAALPAAGAGIGAIAAPAGAATGAAAVGAAVGAAVTAVGGALTAVGALVTAVVQYRNQGNTKIKHA